MYGWAFKEWRILRKMTQYELSFQIEVSQQTLSNWENNITEPSLVQLEKLCYILKIPVWLFFYDVERCQNHNISKKHLDVMMMLLESGSPYVEDIVEVIRRVINMVNKHAKFREYQTLFLEII